MICRQLVHEQVCVSVVRIPSSIRIFANETVR
jgi:hypothetical protein